MLYIRLQCGGRVKGCEFTTTGCHCSTTDSATQTSVLILHRHSVRSQEPPDNYKKYSTVCTLLSWSILGLLISILYCSQWLHSAGTAFRHLCLAFYHLKLPFRLPPPTVVAPPPGFVLMVHTVFLSVDFLGKSLQISSMWQSKVTLAWNVTLHKIQDDGLVEVFTPWVLCSCNYVCVCLCVCTDSDTERLSLELDEAPDETILNSIDRLSGACFMRSPSYVYIAM